MSDVWATRDGRINVSGVVGWCMQYSLGVSEGGDCLFSQQWSFCSARKWSNLYEQILQIYAVLGALVGSFQGCFVPRSCCGIVEDVPNRQTIHHLGGECTIIVIKIFGIGDIVVLRVLHSLDRSYRNIGNNKFVRILGCHPHQFRRQSRMDLLASYITSKIHYYCRICDEI